MVEGTWRFNPETAILFVSVMEDIKAAYESSYEDGNSLIDLMCYILNSTVILDKKEILTDIPSTLTKLGITDPGELN